MVVITSIFEEISGLKCKSKKSAAFGCYGWSGESVEIISVGLKSARFNMVDAGIKVMWNPDKEKIAQRIE